MSADIFDADERLREEYVQDSFHSYLKSSLAQAKAERLLDVEMLSSAEADLAIIGPALCLYFAALRSTTNPPSVPLPRKEKRALQIDLSESNCPKSFISFLQLWATTVPDVQGMPPEDQHDLARVICDLSPLARSPHTWLSRIAADLRAVAIEISLRRSFQDRYANDLQAAIDTGAGAGTSARASYVPPPAYSPSTTSPNQSADKASPPPPPPRLPPRVDTKANLSLPGPFSASLISPTSPAIELIRETLYAALADVLSETSSLRSTLHTDPPRAYFGSVALAILVVASTAIRHDGAVRGVMGKALTLEECPQALRPLMMELAAIGRAAAEMEDEDTEDAMRLAAAGQDIPTPRLERVRTMLEHGAGYDASDRTNGRVSVEGRAVAFANRVNVLALSMTRLPAFRERQDEVFRVLSGVV